MQRRTPVGATIAKRKALSNLSTNIEQTMSSYSNKINKVSKRKRSCDKNILNESDKLRLCYYTFDTPVGEFYVFVDKYPNHEGNNALRACGWVATETESKSTCQNIHCRNNIQDEKRSLYAKLLLPFYTHADIEEIDDSTRYDWTDTRAIMSTIHKLYDYFHTRNELLEPPPTTEQTHTNTNNGCDNEENLERTEKWNESLNKLLDSIPVQFPSQVSTYTRTVWEVLRRNVKAGQVLSYKALADLTCTECNRVQAQSSSESSSSSSEIDKNANGCKSDKKRSKTNTSVKESKPSPRGVGRAMATNPVPIVIPCHRVLSSDLHLHGYGPGLHRKVWLLQHEHANVDADMLSLFAHDKRPYE